MKIIFICVNYNNSAYTVAAVDSILRNSNSSRCIIVDNDSMSDDLVPLHECVSRNDRVSLVQSDVNVGYFPALNLGIDAHLKSGRCFDVVIIGNNDILFSEDLEASLIECEDLLSRYPVISPNITNADGLKQNPHVIDDVSKVRLFFYSLYFSNYFLGLALKWLNDKLHLIAARGDEEQFDLAQEINQGHGSCYILSPVFFEKVGSLDAPTLLYGEEYFLQIQLQKLGFKIYYQPSIKVYHDSHASVSMMPKRRHWELMKKAFSLEKALRIKNKE